MQPHESSEQWRTPIAGQDFEVITEYPVYTLPIIDILSPKAADIFRNLKQKKNAPLDEICEAVSTMVKETIAYHFDDTVVQGYGINSTEDIAAYNSTMRPDHPTLLGTCKDGVKLGMLIWKALGVNAEASYLSTVTDKGFPHAVLRVTSNEGDRIINTMSGSMSFGLIRNRAQLEKIGTINTPSIPLHLVEAESAYGDREETAQLQPTDSAEIIVFQVDQRIMGAFKAKFVANVHPSPEDPTIGDIIPFINAPNVSGKDAILSRIKPRKLWHPDIEHKRILQQGTELCRKRITDCLE